jgi:hypothetical protein
VCDEDQSPFAEHPIGYSYHTLPKKSSGVVSYGGLG